MTDRPKPSATVVVVRRAARPLEVLLLQRSGERRPWVFPGGKVDPGDRLDAEGPEGAGRRAAVREAREEAGLALDPAALVPLARWVTPEVSPKRFDTLFFAARVAPEVAVAVDGGEIARHRWFEPREALEAFAAGEIRLAPPTFVTVHWLAEHSDADRALAALARREVVTFRPRIHRIEQGACILYPGDAGYDDGDLEREGPRHRLWTLPEGWRYERLQAAARRSGV